MCVREFLPHVPSEAVTPWFRLLLALEAAVDEEEEEEEDDVEEVAAWTEAGVAEGEASRSADSISVKHNPIDN